MDSFDEPVENQVLSDVHTFQNYERLPDHKCAITRFQFNISLQDSSSLKKQISTLKHKPENADGEKTIVKRRKCVSEESACVVGKEESREDSEEAIGSNASPITDAENPNLISDTVDDDGDFDGRRNPEEYEEEALSVCETVKNSQRTEDTAFINIKHHLATGLNAVGEQVWLGALLLCDYILNNPGAFTQQTVLDLGAGTGLTSIVAALYASRVICTDTGENVLQLAQENVDSACLYHSLPQALCPVDVRELDWFKDVQAVNEAVSGSHSMTVEDLKTVQAAPVLLAADVVYDDAITDAFFTTVWNLLQKPPSKTLYIGLEKRYVFTVEDLDVTSPAYLHFSRGLDSLLVLGKQSGIDVKICSLPTDFTQYFQYTRTKQLELWKVCTIFTEPGVT